jgi:RNA polymerase sigma-70 factor (ECF subfamily)
MSESSRPPEPGELTVLLAELGGGDRSVLDRVLPIAYEELRRLAHHHLVRERTGHTLDTTALVHEAYLKLAGADSLTWKGRAHFFAVCAQAMRRVLVNHAEARKTAKRGGRALHVPIEDVVAAASERPDDILWVDEALGRLERVSPRQTRVVECRVFAGMGVPETAEALGISPATVNRDWTMARAWLTREAGTAT